MTQETSALDPSLPVRRRSTEELFSELYQELRKIAAQRMAHERPGDTLQATALVNEAWLRLQADAVQEWRDEKHLIAAASEAMRRILVDRARNKLCQRNGGGWKRTSADLERVEAETLSDDTTLLVDELLDRFNREHADKVGIVELRFFAGLSYREIASLLETSERSVRRTWRYAKAWMLAEAEKLRQSGNGQS